MFIVQHIYSHNVRSLQKYLLPLSRAFKDTSNYSLHQKEEIAQLSTEIFSWFW